MNDLLINTTSRQAWVGLIAAAWQASIAGIFEAGRLLAKAKDELDYGEFVSMVETDLPFTRRTASRLMAIAADERLTDGTHVSHLPPHWGTLYELTKLPDDVFEEKIADGTIHPEMQRKDVAKENRLITKARDEARVLALAPVPGKFRTLVIDPPWDYEWLSLAGRAAPGYATMTHEELLAIDVAQWAADDCMMYLWVTNNFMTRGCDLMAKWGWQHKTVLTWVKPRIGLGSYFRNTTEHVLVGARGDAKTRRSDCPTHFMAEMGEHSAKPEAFYEIVRTSSYPAFGEIFQREARSDFKNLYQTKVMIEAAAGAAA